MVKTLASIFFATATAIFSNGIASNAYAECDKLNKGIYEVIASKIERSNIAKLNKLSCTERIEINKYDLNSTLITSGRKRGVYTICLSDNNSNPCKHVIGTFYENKNPSDMLSQVFDIPEQSQDQLNETIERLFFKPSILID